MSDILNSVRAELLRLRRWPAFWILLGSWLALNLVFSYVFNYIAYKSGDVDSRFGDGLPKAILLQQMLPQSAPAVFTQGMAMFGGALMLVLGALAVGSGYGWGTWKTVFTQGPSRASALIACLGSLIAVVVALVTVALSLDIGVGAVIAVAENQPLEFASAGHTLAGLGTGIAILTMWTLAGAIIGAIARGPALAVGLGLVWVLVVENLLRGVGAILGPLERVTNYLPGTAAGSLAGAMQTVKGGETPGVLNILSRTQSIAVLTVYMAVFLLGTLWLMRSRDLT